MSFKPILHNSNSLSSLPGPGAYDPKINSPSFKYSMKMKYNKIRTDITPGPGNYNIRVDKDLMVPSYKFGSEKKNSFYKNNDNPGPGNYGHESEILRRSMPKFSFGHEERSCSSNKKYTNRAGTPGPGAYEYKSFICKEAPKISMSKKTGGGEFGSANRSTVFPGPGQYNTTNSDAVRTKAPSYKIGTSKRDGSYKSNKQSPAPGTYEYTDKATMKNPPRCVIGTCKRPPLSLSDKNMPGVGAYNISHGLGVGPKYSMLGKKTEVLNGSKLSPGPGAYKVEENFSTLQKNPSWKIGTGGRDSTLQKSIKENIPGPGTYGREEENNGPKYRFGSQKRGEVKKDNVPGPGAYKIPCQFADVNDYTRESGKFNSEYRYV